MNRETIEDLTDWMLNEVKTHDYGEINTTIRMHDGKIALIERYTVEKIKPTTTGAPGGYHETERS